MTFKQFWELSELYTAPLNIFLIILGTSFVKWHLGIAWHYHILIYTVIILLFHVAVNIFNNYMDYKNASDAHDYKVASNIIGRDQLSLPLVWKYFVVFMSLATVLGLFLAWRTSWLILIPGTLGFYIGLSYSAGPWPLNSLPIAESVTSLASGYFVPLVSAFVMVFPSGQTFTWRTGGELLLVCIPTVLMMFNNLLANNTCDLEEDIVNGRRTLVFYLRQPRAVKLLQSFFLVTIISLPFLVWLQLAPWPVLLLVGLAPFLWRNMTPYFKQQDKRQTFPLVLKTMGAIMASYPVLYLLGVLFS